MLNIHLSRLVEENPIDGDRNLGLELHPWVIWVDRTFSRSGSRNFQRLQKLDRGTSVVQSFADVLRFIDRKASFHPFLTSFSLLTDVLGRRDLGAIGTKRENRVSEWFLTTNEDIQRTKCGVFYWKSTSVKEILVCKCQDISVVTVAFNAFKVFNDLYSSK